MNKFSVKYKIIAFLLGLAFVFQSMSTINSHTYTTGVDSYHYTCGCFGCWPTHLAVKCGLNKIYHTL